MHIITFTHAEGLSGGARQALYQTISFFQKDIKTTFLCLENTPLHRQLIQNSIPTELLKKTWAQRAQQIKKLIKKDEDTVIHSFHSPGLKLLALYGIIWKMQYPRLICLAHRGVSTHPRNPFPYWSPGIDAFVPNSNYVKKQLQHFLPFDNKVQRIYNGIPKERVIPTESKEKTRAELAIDNNAFVIISILNASPRKGLDDLLEAFALLTKSNVYLILIGISGEDERILAHPKKNYIRTLGTEDIMNFLHSADLFVFPSRSFDSMPNVILEAMSSSLPIIATDVGGSRELIKNNGFIIPTYNPTCMSEAITTYIDTPTLLQQHAQESSLLANNFTIEKRVEQLLALYQKLLKKRKKGL
ncbi:MAG: glycosyltransferase family 4 protein [Desulfovibrionaceae bacterium]